MPEPSAAELTKLQNQVRLATDQARKIAESMEQGLSRQPLCEAVDDLPVGGAQSLPAAVVLCVGDEGEAEGRLATPFGDVEVIALLRAEEILDDPALSSQAIEGADVLVLLGSDADDSNAEALTVATDLSALVPAALPLVEAGVKELPKRGWWTAWRPVPTCVKLSAAFRAGGASDAGVEPPAAASTLSSALQLSSRAARLSLLVDLFVSTNKGRSARYGARKALLTSRTLPTPPAKEEAAQRGKVDRIKASVDAELSELQEGIADLNRRARDPGNEETRKLERLVDSLAPGDLEREKGSRVVKLTLRPDVVTRMERAALGAARDRLKSDLELVSDAVELVERRVNGDIEAASGRPGRARAPRPDENKIWNAISAEVRTDLQYRGEIPKRTLMQRVQVGRRPMFLLMMGLSVIGGAAGVRNLRNAWPVSLAMALLFIGGFVWTFFSWRKEDEELIDKELHKVRGALRGELRKIMTNVERERMSRTQALLGEVRKSLFQAIDAGAQEGKGQRAERAERTRNDAKERIKSLDRVLREAQGLDPRLVKLRQSVSEADRGARALVRSVAKELDT